MVFTPVDPGVCEDVRGGDLLMAESQKRFLQALRLWSILVLHLHVIIKNSQKNQIKGNNGTKTLSFRWLSTNVDVILDNRFPSKILHCSITGCTRGDDITSCLGGVKEAQSKTKLRGNSVQAQLVDSFISEVTTPLSLV